MQYFLDFVRVSCRICTKLWSTYDYTCIVDRLCLDHHLMNRHVALKYLSRRKRNRRVSRCGLYPTQNLQKEQVIYTCLVTVGVTTQHKKYLNSLAYISSLLLLLNFSKQNYQHSDQFQYLDDALPSIFSSRWPLTNGCSCIGYQYRLIRLMFQSCHVCLQHAP